MNENSSSIKYNRISLLLFSLSVVLGSVSVAFSELRIGSYGLIHSLPPTFFVAIFLLTLSFLITLKFNAKNKAFLFLHLIMLVFFLYFLAALIEKTPRFTYVYLVYGYTDFIMQQGHTDTSIFTYQYWPGLMYLGGIITRVAGLSPLALLIGFPITVQLISLPLLYILLNRVSENPKMVWVGLWLYYVAGWVNQGYYTSPALGYLFFLFIVFLVLFWMWEKGESRFHEKGAIPIILIIVFLAIVTAHLLSSIVALISLAILYLLFRIRGPQRFSFIIPVLFVIILAASLYNPAGGFLSGTTVTAPAEPTVTTPESPQEIVTNRGRFSGQIFKVVANLQGAYQATIKSAFMLGEEHTNVMFIKVMFSTVFFILAASGLVYAIIKRKMNFSSRLMLGLLAGTCSIIFIGAYGGEIVARAFGYSLPFMAFFAAKNLDSKILSVPLMVFLVISPPLFVASAYGNEKLDYVSPPEIKGAEFFYDYAPDNAKVYGLMPRIWSFKHIEYKHWRPLDLESPDPFRDIVVSSNEGEANYVVLNERDVNGSIFLRGNVDAEKLRGILRSPESIRVYSSQGFDLFKLSGG